MLILDEAHAAAPATATKYVTDSKFTAVIRDVAPRFENRLFLSATPHNGHSNSFAALLELLDPQRFTRGVPVESTADLKPVMVRRLKNDLRLLGLDYPIRRLITLELNRTSDAWTRTTRSNDPDAPSTTTNIASRSSNAPDELVLANMLADYTKLAQSSSGRSKFVFVNLQKRLLSSVPAFYRTLKAHARGKIDIPEDTGPDASKQRTLDAELYGMSDEELDSQDEHDIITDSRDISLTEQATQLRDEMLLTAEKLRYRPDAKISALLDWIREHQCKGAGLPGKLSSDEKSWSNTRILIFTEYGDTRKYIEKHLRLALENTHQGDDRVLSFYGAISDEQREYVRASFNDPEHPVRILVATDAAREGVNLQGACADLLHYDLPWNPSRLEQRNGRIDRTLQPSPEVRCMYFSYPERPADRILEVIVEKIDVIQRELGSLGTVVMDQIEAALADGIDDHILAKINAADTQNAERSTVQKRQLEQTRNLSEVQKEIDSASRALNKSQKEFNFHPDLLRDALNAACELTLAAHASPGATDATAVSTHLTPSSRRLDAFEIPTLPDSWERTLDYLRPPKLRDEEYWEWRSRPLLPVTFDAPKRISEPVVHLHLEHPFVQRMLSRFRSQGFAAHDLSRVTVLPTKEAIPRAIAFGRLSLFGKGATRLHDELIAISAPWFEAGGPDHLKPESIEDDKKIFQNLDQIFKSVALKPIAENIPHNLIERLRKTASDNFSALWSTLEEEAEARTQLADIKLKARAEEDAAALEKILINQRRAIEKQIQQTTLNFSSSKDEQDQLRQFKKDAEHMELRYKQIEREITDEPEQLRELFQVELKRLEPVGLVYLWPETRK